VFYPDAVRTVEQALLEKQRDAVPQDAGKTPSVCPSQRENTYFWSERQRSQKATIGTNGLHDQSQRMPAKHSVIVDRTQSAHPETIATESCDSPLSMQSQSQVDGISEWLVQDIVSPETTRRASHQTDTAINRYVIQQLDQVRSRDKG
jgi:hypothetical protein